MSHSIHEKHKNANVQGYSSDALASVVIEQVFLIVNVSFFLCIVFTSIFENVKEFFRLFYLNMDDTDVNSFLNIYL